MGLTENTFKTGFNNHKASFNSYQKRNSTERSKYVWGLKRENVDYSIRWKILKRAKFAFLFNAFTYTKIYLVVRKMARSRNQPQDSGSDGKFERLKLFLQNVKQAKSSFTVVICFYTFVFLPSTIATLFYDCFDKFEALAILVLIYAIVYSNSCVNSVILFWSHLLLKKDARKMLKNVGLYMLKC